MTPVWMRVRHDPPNSYGDCSRACLASILDLPASEVPHFVHDDPSPETYRKRLWDWQVKQGVGLLSVRFNGPLEDLMASADANSPGVYWILLGQSPRGCNHEVVCLGGEIVHDPNILGGGIVGPAGPSGSYHATFILHPKTVKHHVG